jgi:hypothetical protein
MITPAKNFAYGSKDFLALVNRLSEYEIDDLGLDANDWPQICVVGGQSEGKSTVLSAIVSNNLGSKLNFLPEGKGIVTRCPITVQMRSTKGGNHTAAVFAPSSGSRGSSSIDGPGGIILNHSLTACECVCLNP